MRVGVLSSSSPSANPVGLLGRVAWADLKGTSALLNDAPQRHAPTDLHFTSLANLAEDLFFALSFIKAQAPVRF